MGSSGAGASDVANELKSAFIRGLFPCIDSTTFEEYKTYISSDPVFERYFVKINVDELSKLEAFEIIESISPIYERHHQVSADKKVLKSCIKLSNRFIHECKLSSKALCVVWLSDLLFGSQEH